MEKGEAVCDLDSTKGANQVFLPVSGKIIEINEELNDKPQLINESPLEKGWIAKIEVTGNVDGLMNDNEYKEFLKTCEH